MFRSLALAVGISLVVLGVECLVVERVVMAGSQTLTASTPASHELAQAQSGPVPTQAASTAREIMPPEWAPWVLLSVGAVIILYSFTIPRRVSGG